LEDVTGKNCAPLGRFYTNRGGAISAATGSKHPMWADMGDANKVIGRRLGDASKHRARPRSALKGPFVEFPSKE